jgi:DNA/RNA endonuclease G (NUC1)
VIAVEMPNDKTNPPGWPKHRVSVDRIESITRYDFLSVLPNALEAQLEARKDAVAIQ